MENSASAQSSAASSAPTTTDGRDLSELLRSMTTTTTIERFDDPTTKVQAAESLSVDADVNFVPPKWDSSPSLPQISAVPASISRSYKVLGTPTHAFCQIFSDRIVLGVTQLQKGKEKVSSGHIGSWVYCQASRSQIDPRQVDYDLSTLLGGNKSSGSHVDEKEIYARRIAERLLEKKSLPGGSERIVLLLGISLLNLPPSDSMNRFKVLVEVMVELVEEALKIVLG